MNVRRFPSIVIALLAVAGSAEAKPAKPAAAQASTQDPEVLKQVANGKAEFLHVESSIGGSVARGARLLLDVEGLDPLVRTAFVREFVESGRVDLVEREALGEEGVVTSDAPPAPAAKGSPPPAAASVRTRVFGLTAENLAVEAPNDATRWAPPDRLIAWSLDTSPDEPTSLRFIDPDASGKGGRVCASLRLVAAASGVVQWQGIRCAPAGDESVDGLRADLLAEGGKAAGLCARGERVLQLPATVVSGTDQRVLPTTAREYESLNEALAAAGCGILDVPPGAGEAGGPDTWSYHPSKFERVGATRIKGWQAAEFAVQVRAFSKEVPVADIRDRLAGIDAQILDPDLVLAKDGASVTVLSLEVKAVDLATGRLVTSARVETGRAMPGDLLAGVVADLVLGRSPSAWVEVHPLPVTATVKVDRSGLATPEGTGLARLEPGTHSAELFLGGTKAEASASFSLRKHDFGILAMAAPYGALEVVTTPEVADIAVDGNGWGKSPVTRTLGGGEHTVVASLPDCGQAEATVQVEVGGALTRTVVHLPGFVEASVTPVEATIFLDDVELGAGSAKARDVKYGEHTITYKLAGYKDHTETIDVGSCATSTHSYNMSGKVSLASLPEGAEFRINGETKGRTPEDVTLRPGDYTVSCHWCEYGNAEAPVTITPGQVTPIELTLDGSGTRLAYGLNVGVLSAGGAPELGAGLVGEVWFGGRGGIQATGSFGLGGSTVLTLGGAYRLLAPAPGWSMPIGVRGVHILGGGSGGQGTLGFHACSGKNAAWTIGLAAGGLADDSGAGFLGSLDVGILWRTGSTWRERPAN